MKDAVRVPELLQDTKKECDQFGVPYGNDKDATFDGEKKQLQCLIPLLVG